MTPPAPTRDAGTEVFAAVDIGTNSFHLVVARVVDNQRFEVVASEKEMIRLGSGSGDMKRLAPDAVERGVACLRRFRQIALAAGADGLIAVATSAVRESDNRDAFIDRCRVEAGVEVDVISGVEEARLIHLGVLQAVPVYDRQLALIDIGGGSTEFLVGRQHEVIWSRSLKVGAIRLTERFFPGGRTDARSVRACIDHLRSFLAPNLAEAAAHGFEVLVGSSGTIENLVAMAAFARDGQAPRSVNNLTMSLAELDVMAGRLVAARTAETRSTLPGVEAHRADLLPAGALLLQAAMRELGATELLASTFALREGVLLDQVRRRDGRGDGLHHLSDLRRASIGHTLDRFGDGERDRQHAQWTAELALQIFVQARLLHGLDDTALDYLEAGALLANIGRSIAHDAHHLHSAYLIRNAEQLAGFTSHEIELVAQIARYHRKSAPKSKHPEFAALRPPDKRLLRVLAGILRVAIGLDRGHRQVVSSVECRHDGPDGRLVIVARTADPEQASLEAYTASTRTGLLADTLGVPVEVTLAGPS